MKKLIALISIVAISCQMIESNFLSETELKNGPDQRPNADFVDRVKKDNDITEDSLQLSFYFITNKKSKIDLLAEFINSELNDYQIIEIVKIDDTWELRGRSPKVLMELESVNHWEKELWTIGARFDCKLDGWETIYE